MLHLDEINLLIEIDAKMESMLTPQMGEESVLWEAMRYSALAGGKRIRPLLTYAAGSLSNSSNENLLILGSAIELIHCYSLIHDDLPAMDNDDLRRGVPTCHKKYNETVAILAGDALQALAFAILSNDKFTVEPLKKIQIINMLANYIGVNGMAGGQNIDLLSGGANLTLNELQNMHAMKTGCLIKGAVLTGYLCGIDFNEITYQKLIIISNKIGLMFQIVDDILDVTSSTEVLGKTANKDFLQDKATYVSILGMNEAKASSTKLRNEIISLLEEIPGSNYLKDLTESIYKRNS